MRRCLSLLLAVTVTASLAAGLLARAATPAAAASCPAPGGVAISRAAAPDADFAILGKGWGHGTGMSQYGARGAARLGCRVDDILAAYYPGTSIGAADTNRRVRIGLTVSSSTSNVVRRLRVRAVGGTLAWRACSGSCTTVAKQPAGTTWRLRVRPDGSFALFEARNRRWAGSARRLRVPLSRSDRAWRIAELPVKARAYRWGRLEFRPLATPAGPRATAVAVLPGIERYLRGLAEMPSSWETPALEAQATVGRSYALVKRAAGVRAACRCHLYDSPADQAYAGWTKEHEGNGTYGARWVAAVDATARRVLRDSAGAVAVGTYSSSHGGHSESARFVWGGQVAYLQAVDDSNWEANSANPIRTWSVGLSAAQLGKAFKVGTATKVVLPRPKGAAGRVGRPDLGYGGVRIEGTEGMVAVSGDHFRRTVNAFLGWEAVRSTLFTVVRPGA